MRPEERLLGLAIPIGFVAFTLPLLYSDTKHLWASPAPRDEAPPPPPSWHQHAPDADSPKGRFRLAASSGDVASAAALVAERGKELLTVDAHSGNSPLFEAARAGHEDMVRFLLDNGAEVNRPNEWGDTPVNEAATMGHWPIVWLLVDHGAAVVTKPDGAAHSGHSGLLLAAVRHRSLEALSKLHSLGLDLNTRHYAGNTALHEAARSGEKELVSFLISARANFDAENELGRTALAEAASMGHVDVVWSLLHAGASLGSDAQRLSLAMDAVRRSSLDLLDALREAGMQIDAQDTHGASPLLEACRHGNSAAVEWLLQHGANASARSNFGETPIGLAAHGGYFELVWRLHEAGADVNVHTETGSTLLMSAVYFENEREVQRLLDAGLDADHATARGDSALSIAVSKGNVPIARMLRRRGASLGPRGTRWDAPLHRAARFRRYEAARWLVTEEHADVNAVNKRGDTALIDAAHAGSTQIVELLLQHGANANHRSARGTTAVLEAADAGALRCLQALHRGGADMHVRDEHGDGAVERARWTKQADAVREWLGSVGVQPVDGHEGHGGGEGSDGGGHGEVGRRHWEDGHWDDH